MKKLLSILLTLCLLTGLMTACGTTESGSAPAPSAASGDSQVEAPEEVSEAPAPEPAQEESEIEFPSEAEPPEEEEFVYELPLTTGGETLTMFAISNSNVTDNIGDLNNHQIYQKAEEVTGVHVDIQTYMQETSAEQFSLVLASGDYPDMVRSGVYPSGLASAFAEEIIIDFADYLDCAPNYARILEENPNVARDAKTDEGSLLEFFFLNAYNGEFTVPATEGPVIRKDLLEAEGLDRPETVEALHDVLARFKSAYNLDDPLYLGNNVFGASGFLMGAFDASSELYQVDGQVKYGPLEPGFKEYLELMTDWYAEGIVNSDFYSYDDNPMSTVTEGKKVGGAIGVFMAPALNLSAYCSESVSYEGMRNMTNAQGENHMQSPVKVVDTSKGMTVTTGCDNPELAVRWCDFWYSDVGRLLSNYGIEDVTFTYDENGDPQWTDLLTNNADGLSLGIARQCFVTLTQQPGVCPKEIEIGLLDDNAMEAVEIWAQVGDGDYSMPNVALTAEESARAAQILSDIDTLNNETWYKILMGQQSMDTWDAYIQSVQDMGIQEYIDIYQTAVDRYQQR